MSWEIVFVFALLAFAVGSFWMEKMPPDQIAATVFAGVIFASALPFSKTLPELGELLRVFASPAPITIAGMFILSAALEKTGVIEAIARQLGKLQFLGYRGFLAVLMLTVALASAFVNNTPVVMVFLPVVLRLSREMGVPASKMLIPLSFASILGGMCTLVGTSTNILASSVLAKAGREPIGMFEMAWVGGPLLVIGIIYLTLFADRLLPSRDTITSLLTDEDRKEFITEVFVQHGAPIAGQTVEQSQLLKGTGIRLLELVRDNVELRVDPKTTALEEGDRLVLAARPSGFAHARSIRGLAMSATEDLGIEAISAHEGMIVEGIVGPQSQMIGSTIRELNFRQRYRVVLIAIHRRGVNLRESIETIRFEAGDLLLMMGTEQAIDNLRQSSDILLLDQPAVPSRSLRKRAPAVLALLVGAIGAAALGWMPIEGSVLVGVAAVLALGVLTPKEGYLAIDWSILVLIFGMLGLGQAMQTTGAADLLARGLSWTAGFDAIPAEIQPQLVLALLYLTTMVLTETLSNNATVVLMTPVALSLGATMGLDPRPFVIATCLAASASFSTPIGYQTNTYVYGAAGYRFTDFTRVGLPLNMICLLVAILLIPRIWGF